MKLNHFKVEKLNLKEEEHYVLAKKLERSAKIDYISPHFITFLEKKQTNNYVLKDEENHSLGIFGEKPDERDHTTEIWCALQEGKRNQGIGNRFLGEITKYLITEKDYSDVKLVIQKQNKASRKIALENGYQIYRSVDDDKDEFRYFGRK